MEKNGLEIQQIFRRVLAQFRPPFSPGEDTQNLAAESHHIRKNPPYLDETTGTQSLHFFLFPHGLFASEVAVSIFKLAPWFVYTMVMADEEQEENWPEFFENNRLIPVHPSRRKSGSQSKPNAPFRLLFKSVIGISLPQAIVSLLLS